MKLLFTAESDDSGTHIIGQGPSNNQKYGVWMWTGFIWLRIGASVLLNTVMNLGVP
jgi:hypothetical protein